MAGYENGVRLSLAGGRISVHEYTVVAVVPASCVRCFVHGEVIVNRLQIVLMATCRLLGS